MSQLRLNPLNGRWVTIVAERAERPYDFAPRPCRSRRIRTGPARSAPARGGHPAGARDPTAGRSLAGPRRPNLYPAFDGEDPMSVTTSGPVHVQADASGIHEVSSSRPTTPSQLDGPGRRRDDHVHGGDAQPDGGARPCTPTSATPRPSSTTAGKPARRSPTRTGSSSGCRSCRARSSTRSGPSPGSRAAASCARPPTPSWPTGRVVVANDDVVVVCPFWSGTPYEMLVIPARHEGHLYDSPDAAWSPWAGRSATC